MSKTKITDGTATGTEEDAAVDARPVTQGQTIQGEGEAAPIEDSEDDADERTSEGPAVVHGVRWGRVVTYGVLPALALLLAMAAGYLKWLNSSVRDSQEARIESVRAATDSTVALLSYKPDTVDKDLGGARNRLTGSFKDTYTSLTHDVVIPGTKQKHISAAATVPAAASVSATANHAVVLVFVNQTVIIGNDAPTDSASSVRVTLDKIGDRWLISGFDPV
jgi:Mce-associated membrane protein